MREKEKERSTERRKRKRERRCLKPVAFVLCATADERKRAEGIATWSIARRGHERSQRFRCELFKRRTAHERCSWTYERTARCWAPVNG